MSTRRWNSHERSQKFPVGESLTQQQFRDLADINCIMARWNSTGQLDHINSAQPIYGDFTGAVDYQTSLHMVEEAQASFDALPSALRKRMGNDPNQLIGFMADEDNLQESIDLGLREGEKTPKPAPDTVETPTPKDVETTGETPPVDKP